ncbi:hypothetical protein CaCOL14_013160 [Colletotrichum acutatum]
MFARENACRWTPHNRRGRRRTGHSRNSVVRQKFVEGLESGKGSGSVRISLSSWRNRRSSYRIVIVRPLSRPLFRISSSRSSSRHLIIVHYCYRGPNLVIIVIILPTTRATKRTDSRVP